MLRWAACGTCRWLQTLTFPYFILFTLWTRHRCRAQMPSDTLLSPSLVQHSPKKKSKPVRYLHSFILPLSFPFPLVHPFHHMAVVSVFVSPLNSGKLLWDGLKGNAAMVQLYCVPLQRQRDSSLIFQVSWVFCFSMLEWAMPHASNWGINHVPPA